MKHFAGAKTSAKTSDGSGLKPGLEPGFFVGPEARLLGKGSSPGQAWARGQMPERFEGLLKYDFFEKIIIILDIFIIWVLFSLYQIF